MTRRESYLWYLESFLGTPYIWGGDDPFGADCSGLVLEGLQGVGAWPNGQDDTAHGIMTKFVAQGAKIEEADLLPGSLVFRLDSAGKANHVETVWRRTDLSLGASGGDSSTKTIDDAKKQNAFVKLRPHARLGTRVFVDPFFKDGVIP